MYVNESNQNIWLIIGFAIASVVAVAVFAFLFFIVWPTSAVEAAQNQTVTVNGEQVDPAVAKVAEVQNVFYHQSMAMINGTYWV